MDDSKSKSLASQVKGNCNLVLFKKVTDDDTVSIQVLRTHQIVAALVASALIGYS